MVKEYNEYMGGVDLNDQYKALYELDRKSKYRFYLRIFFDMMDTAVVNAALIFQKSVNDKM